MSRLLAPGRARYLTIHAGQTYALSDELGFNLVGYGCIDSVSGTSVRCLEPIETAIKKGDLTVAVLPVTEI